MSDEHLMTCKLASGDEESSKMEVLADPAIWHGLLLPIFPQL